MSVNIQFHMLPTELLEFVDDVRTKHNLDVELEAWTPKSTRLVKTTESLVEAAKQFGVVDRFWFLVCPRSSNTPEKLMLNAARMRGNRVNQADLGAGAKSAEGQKILRNIASELRRRTTAGVWVVGEFGGPPAFARNFRISQQATDSSRNGTIELVGIGFVQNFYPDEPSA